MLKCNNCRITILDETRICPLCRQVLVDDHEPAGIMQKHSYPDVIGQSSHFRMAKNIVLFVSIVVEFLLLGGFFLAKKELVIPAIVGLILCYVNVLMSFTLVGKSQYVIKVISMIIFAVLVMDGIDFLTGEKGWSMELIWPLAVIALNIYLLVLIIVDRQNWQSYMVYELISMALSAVPLIFLALHKITFPYVAYIAATDSGMQFLGTLIIGDYRARTELKRRFHI